MDDSSNDPTSPEASSSAPAPVIDQFTLHGGDTAMAGGIGDETASHPYPMTQDWNAAVGDAPATADVAGTRAEADAEEQAWIRISLRKISHMMKRDEFTFVTVDGKEILTDRDEWERVLYKNKHAWFIRNRGVYYYTRIKPTA